MTYLSYSLRANLDIYDRCVNRESLNCEPRVTTMWCDSSMLVTTSGDCSARVWRTSDWSMLRELRHDTQRWVWDAAFSIDSRYLFTGTSLEHLHNAFRPTHYHRVLTVPFASIKF